MTFDGSSIYGVVKYLGCFDDIRHGKDDVVRSVFERDKIPFWTNYPWNDEMAPANPALNGLPLINNECNSFNYEEGQKC